MGTQNLNNFYFNRLDSKLNYSEYYDLFLASDEKDFNTEVVWSNSIIGYNNGDTLPVWIDLSDPNCGTQPNTTLQCTNTLWVQYQPIILMQIIDLLVF